MDTLIRDKLLSEVPGLKYKKLDINGLPKGDWFIFEANPLPKTNDIQKVIADIQHDRNIFLYQNGALGHSPNCHEHDHQLSKRLKNSINKIAEQKFIFAIWENEDGIFNNQPIVIILEPEVTYSFYPDHLHINACQNTANYLLPESICYTDRPEDLGDNQGDRIKEAVEQTCIWLFAHQVWLATRKNGEGIWIIPDVKAEDEQQFAFYRSPHGQCRCKSGKQYKECHLNQDYLNICNSSYPADVKNFFIKFMNDDGKLNLELYTLWWRETIFKPQIKAMEILKRTLTS